MIESGNNSRSSHSGPSLAAQLKPLGNCIPSLQRRITKAFHDCEVAAFCRRLECCSSTIICHLNIDFCLLLEQPLHNGEVAASCCRLECCPTSNSSCVCIDFCLLLEQPLYNGEMAAFCRRLECCPSYSPSCLCIDFCLLLE
jgi:hypothetical protein